MYAIMLPIELCSSKTAIVFNVMQIECFGRKNALSFVGTNMAKSIHSAGDFLCAIYLRNQNLMFFAFIHSPVFYLIYQPFQLEATLVISLIYIILAKMLVSP